eukprot:7386354-Prymnesium_polylepis.1
MRAACGLGSGLRVGSRQRPADWDWRSAVCATSASQGCAASRIRLGLGCEAAVRLLRAALWVSAAWRSG